MLKASWLRSGTGQLAGGEGAPRLAGALRKKDHIRFQKFPGPEHPRLQEKTYET